MKSALLIIDVQNAMVLGDNPVYASQETITNIQNLIRKARIKQVPIIYIQHNEVGSEFEYGLDSWQIFEGIKPMKDDILIHKTFSDAFKETDLKQILEHSEINNLVVVGMQTDYCINASSTRAVELGYTVTIIKDAHSTWAYDGFSAEEIIRTHQDEWSKNMTLVYAKDFDF